MAAVSCPCEGESAEALLPDMIATSLAKLPIPKLMRWGASDVHFVRPVHTVTLLLGDTVIPATILGVASDRVIRGHRFMGEPGSLSTMLTSIRRSCWSAVRSLLTTNSVRPKLKRTQKTRRVRLAVKPI